ncbi:hypothetical protein [Halobacteriovorax sp. HLS]|uniref:hypothetical protein n=1 Tax=Halobacteriovorax sp. HLS TaxID=2234000 RepID=UPI000FD80C96|nr:hypothetical protein [Halobacteriovorax sp. HLS]
MKFSLLCLSLFLSLSSYSQVKLIDIGVIGLASHDMFTWDKDSQTNLENGRLDLSTIFDYENGGRWEQGGNPKNAENAPVWSITKRLVNFYKSQLEQVDPVEARLRTVELFHSLIEESFTRMSGLEFPHQAIDDDVTNTEQAVLRALHDILPGRVKTYRGRLFPLKEFALTNFVFAKFYLNEEELDQSISYYNGDYDEEYKKIKIPFSRKTVNLKEVDKSFIENFSSFSHQEMLDELASVGRGDSRISEVSFINHFKELFAKGVCSKGNKWIRNKLICL